MKRLIYYLALPTMVIFSPLFLLNKIFLNGDAIHFSYPAAEFMGSRYLSALNPNLYLGFPWQSSFHYAYFNPLYLIVYKIFDYVTAYHFILLADFIFAGIFFYLFVRALDLDEQSSAMSSLVYVFSQFNVFWLNSVTITNAVFLLPAIFWILAKVSIGRSRYAVALPLLFGYAFLGAHYEAIVMAFVGGLVYSFWICWRHFDRQKSFLASLKVLWLYLLGLVGGFIIGWPQLSSFLLYFGQTTRVTNFSYDYMSLVDLARFVLPSFNSIIWSRQEFLPFVGVIALFLALLAVVHYWRKDSYVTFFTLFYIFFFSLMLKFSPTAWIFKQLPGLSYISQSVRWIHIANLAVAVLAGIGFRYVTTNFESELVDRYARVIKKILIWLASLLVLLNILYLTLGQFLVSLVKDYFDVKLFVHTSGLPLQYYHSLIEVMAKGLFKNISLGNPKLLILLATLIASYIIISRRKEIGRDKFRKLLVALLILELSIAGFSQIKYADVSLLDKPFFVKVIEQKEKDMNSFRVFSYGVTSAQYQKILALHPDESYEGELFAQEGLIGNTNYVQLVGGLEANADRKVQEVVYFYLNDEKRANIEDKGYLLSMLNAKYVVTPSEITNGRFLLVASSTFTKYEVPLYLYENKDVLPRVYFAQKVKFLRENNDIENLAETLRPGHDFSKITYIECDVCSGAEKELVTKPKVVIVKYADQEIQLETDNQTGGWLVIANANVLGWQAYVDNRATPIYRANYILQAVFVPAGKHKVKLSFENKWWKI
ncbi:MAG TPA: YfhO family protein [Candidatus Paceibacterota bacterium]